MRKKYYSPEAEIEKFQIDMVITTSGEVIDPGVDGDGENEF